MSSLPSLSPRKHFLFYALGVLSLVAAVMSYHRFLVAEDYIVEYEGACEPASESCFIGCVDEECTDIYYYTWVRKRAADVYAQCGPDVTECESASVCLPEDTDCSITYCSSETMLEDESCETLDAARAVPEEPLPPDAGTDLEVHPL